MKWKCLKEVIYVFWRVMRIAGMFSLCLVLVENFAQGASECQDKPPKKQKKQKIDDSQGKSILFGSSSTGTGLICWELEDLSTWIDPNQNDGEDPNILSISPPNGVESPQEFTLLVKVEDASPLAFQVKIDDVQICQTTQYYDTASKTFLLSFPISQKKEGVFHFIEAKRGERKFTVAVWDKGGRKSEVSTSLTIQDPLVDPANQEADELIGIINSDSRFSPEDRAFLNSYLNYVKALYRSGEITPQELLIATQSARNAVSEWDLNIWNTFAATEEERQNLLQTLDDQIIKLQERIASGALYAIPVDNEVLPDFSDPENPFSESDWEWIISKVTRGFGLPQWKIPPSLPWGGVGAISLRVVFDILDGLICCDSSWDRVFCWLSAAGFTATGIIGIVGGGSSGIPWVIIGGIAFLGRGMGKGIDCTRRTACCKLC